MATNLNYSVGVTTSQGVQALTNLQNKIQQTSGSFSGLKSAIAGVVTTGFIASLYQGAAALKDVSDASGIGVQQLKGFQKAVTEFGGSADGALDGVSKLAQAIDSAANGSKPLQDRFLDLGVSLNDLRTLSEGEILDKVVKSLGQGEAGAAKMAAGIDLFGKQFKAVNFQDVAANIDKYTASQKAAAEATIKAERAEQAFGAAVSNLKSALLIALQPISELATKILEAGSAMKEFFRLAIEIGTVLLTFTLLGKVIRGITIAAAGISAAFTGVATVVASTGTAISTFSGILLALFKNIPLLGAIGVGIGLLFGQVKDGLIEMGLVQDKDAKKREEAAEALKRQGGALRDVTDAYAKQRLEIQQASVNFSKQNKNIIDQINLTNGLIGVDKQRSDILKAREEIFKRAAEESDKLRQAQEKLTEAEKKQGLSKVYDQQIAAIKALAEVDAKRVEQAVANTNRLEAVEQLSLFRTKELIDSQNKLKTIQDDIAKSTMSELEKKYYDIESAAKASAKAAIEAEEARRKAKMPIEEQAKYYAEAMKGNQALMDAEEYRYVNERKAATGWKQSMNEYAENATNAAANAKRVFQTMAQGMEDVLMKFFTTGKLGFQDFANSVIQELMRIEIRKMLVGVGTGGGLLGGIGSLLGFANGGVIPTNGPVIVGERGPEILSGAAGRTVTPNNQLGGTNVTYNINAVDAMSFKTMLSQDPTFLFAVSEQGRRRLPGAR